MAATNINRVVLTGNLTRDPELRSLQSGMSVCSLRIASNSRRKDNGEWVDKPNYFSVTVWGAQGENCARFLSKGRPVCIDGRLEWREWQGQDGTKRESVEIVADAVQFLGGRDDAPDGRRRPAATASPRTRTSRRTRRTSRRSPSARATARRRTTTSRSRPLAPEVALKGRLGRPFVVQGRRRRRRRRAGAECGRATCARALGVTPAERAVRRRYGAACERRAPTRRRRAAGGRVVTSPRRG